jgi:hypothetical protein
VSAIHDRPALSPMMSIARKSSRATPPGLAWLAPALGAVPSEGLDTDDGTYVVMPSVSRPQFLASAADRGAAWASLHRHSDAPAFKVRAARELMASACRLGLAETIFPGSMPESLVGLRLGSCAWPELIQEVFGRPDLAVAISVGQIRPQIKPILHVSTRSGQLLGHIKVGWNDVTRSLVRHEASILSLLAGADVVGRAAERRTFRVPHVLYQGRWHDREVLAVSDVGGRSWYRGRRLVLPAAVTRQVAYAAGVRRSVLGTSEFWRDIAERVRRLADSHALDAGIVGALAAAMDKVESWHASAEFDLGLVHGDWAPWNMASAGSRIAVWDWERSRVSGPIGFDSVFFSFQVDLWMRGLPPQQALERAVSGLPETMTASGASPACGPAVLRLVILEIALRQLEGAGAGVTVPDRVYQSLTGLLERTADEEWRPATRTGAACSVPATERQRRGPLRGSRTTRLPATRRRRPTG